MKGRSKQNLSDEVAALSANNEQLTSRLEVLHIKVSDLTAERDELAMKLSNAERLLKAQVEHCKQHAVDMRVIEAQLAGQKSAFETSIRLALESRNGNRPNRSHDTDEPDSTLDALRRFQERMAQQLGDLGE